MSGNFFEDIDFTAGIWNSLHDSSTGTDGGLKPWYESDLYFGFDYGVGDLGIYLTYLEWGIEPSYQATKEISITVPMTIGFSLGDHYENAAGKDQDLGFWSVGVNASMPVSSWELSVGIQYLQLDDFTKTLNGGDDSELIGTIGLISWFLWTFSAYPQEQRVEMRTLTDA